MYGWGGGGGGLFVCFCLSSDCSFFLGLINVIARSVWIGFLLWVGENCLMTSYATCEMFMLNLKIEHKHAVIFT